MMAAAIGLLTAAASPPEPNFCERMAPQIGLKQIASSRGRDAGTEWRVNTASFGQHLFGGTVATSMSVERAEGTPATPEEELRLRKMCGVTKKGAECAVVGPVAFEMGTRRGLVQMTAHRDERATVGVRGTTVYCRPG
jgi:hypothetical protein